MSALLDFGRNRVWTPADLDDLPEGIDWRRVEIVDGVLVVSPQPGRAHAKIVDVLMPLLAVAAVSGYGVTASLGVGIGPTYRVPDLAVIDPRAYGEPGDALTPSDVVLAVEIESPSSITTDRITKPAEYAAAGIPLYWRVEQDPLRLLTFRLTEDRYEQTGEWRAGDTAEIADPFEVRIELDRLLP